MRKKKSMLKRVSYGFGAVLLTILVVVGIWLFLSEDNFDSPYHPFKSEEAKEQFLKLYDTRAKQWPVSSKTEMLDTSYGRTFVRISGPDSAAPLVLMHGASGNSFQWMSNIESLSKHYKVFAIDNIYDNGRSIYSKKITAAEDYVKWLDELFDALELQDNINIAGLSYGGWITSQYTLKHPDRLNKVILIAPAGTVMPLSFSWFMRAIPITLPLRDYTKKFMYWIAEDTVKSGAENRALLDEYIDETYLAVRSFKSKNMTYPTVLTDDELQNLNVPVLFIVGENEKMYSSRVAIERLHKVAPQIQTHLIQNAGHDLTMVQAEAVNNKMLEFLNQPLRVK